MQARVAQRGVAVVQSRPVWAEAQRPTQWQALQSLGSYYVKHSLTHATQTYGLFGVVLGLVAFLHLAALLTLLCAEVNVVRARRLWPRSLMTPFTDNVQLTDADERSYEALATTQQTKGFEDIDVSFDNPTQSG